MEKEVSIVIVAIQTDKEKLLFAAPVFFAGLFMRPGWVRRNTLLLSICLSINTRYLRWSGGSMPNSGQRVRPVSLPSPWSM